MIYYKNGFCLSLQGSVKPQQRGTTQLKDLDFRVKTYAICTYLRHSEVE
jgi:hypothetical protein